MPYNKPKYKKPSKTQTEKFKSAMDKKIKKLKSEVKKLEKQTNGRK